MSQVQWTFTDATLGITAQVTIDTAKQTLTVASLDGAFDINALWLSDGDARTEGYWTLLRSDNSLNMNGTGLTWDDMIKLSSVGLGQDAIDGSDNNDASGKLTFLTEGTSITLDIQTLIQLGGLDATYAGYTTEQWAALTMGLRATSVNGSSSVKLVDTSGSILDSNVAPAITVEAGDAAGATIAETDAALSASGTLTVQDVNAGDVVTISVSGITQIGSVAGLGSDTTQLADMLTFAPMSVDTHGANGNLTWTFASGAESFDYLAEGDRLTIGFTVLAQDAGGLFDTQALVITITGTNDAASITGTTAGQVAEDGTLATVGALTVADSDRGQARFAMPASLAGTYGSFSFDAHTGMWDYALNNAALATQGLTSGQVVTDTLAVASLDGTATETLTVSIRGQDDAATFGGISSGRVQEDGTSLASGTLTVADADAGQAVFVATGSLSGSYGDFTFDLATGQWSYLLRNGDANVQALLAGQTDEDTLVATSADGSTNSITVVVDGRGDVPAAPISDLTGMTREQGFIVQGLPSGFFTGAAVSSAGDVNGDGYADVVVGTQDNVAYILFGGPGAFGTIVDGRQVVDVATLSAEQGFVIEGAAGKRISFTVASAGDVNGDGYGDVVMGEQGFPPDGAYAYVLFGGAAGFGAPRDGRQVVDLTAMTAAEGFVVRGVDAFELTGVSSAGDVNGDGFDDLMFGDPLRGDGGFEAGGAFILFGGAAAFGGADATGRQVVDLETLDAEHGFFVQGEGQEFAGCSVSSAGDVNGDGFADLIVGARQSGASDGSTFAVGAAYIVFGGSGGFGASLGGRQVLDVATLNGAQGFVVRGNVSSINLGYNVASAGDVNGDGFDDVVITTSRESFVVFGAAGGFGETQGMQQVIDVNTLMPSQGFIVVPNSAGRRSVVTSAGDVNGDGFDDLICGDIDDAGGLDPFGSGYATGTTYLLFGGEGSFGALDGAGRQALRVAALNSEQGFVIQGDALGDYAGYSVSAAGDVNGDGFADIIIGAPGSNDDSGYNINAGAAYVVFGGAFGRGTTPVTTTGTAAAEMLVGGLGDDSLAGGGGADAIRGGAGNDLLSIGDLAFRSLDGGSGTDTLALVSAGLTLDLTLGTLASRIAGIEVLDLTGTGNNTLLLDGVDLQGLAGRADAAFSISALPTQLVLRGNAGDVVDLRDLDPDGAGPAELRGWVLVTPSTTIEGLPGELFAVWEVRAGGVALGAVAVDTDIAIL